MAFEMKRRTLADRISYLERKRKEMKVQLYMLSLEIADAHRELNETLNDGIDMMDVVKDGYNGKMTGR